MEKLKKKIKELFKKLGKNTVLAIVIIIIVLVLFLIITNKKGETTITTKSELIKILDISELSSVEYVYNGIATKTKKDNKVAYYVSYNGKVRAGVNIKDIKYDEDPINKKIIVTLPEIQIFDAIVEAGQLDFIFIDTNYDTETVHQEAFNLSKTALENTIKDDKEFYDKARENIESIVRATIEPIIDTKDNEYQLEIK